MRVPAGVRAGYVVYDRERRQVVVRSGERRTFRSASVVKILIALDFLRGRERVTAEELAVLRPMLRSSDDGAATRLWRLGGQRAIIERMVRVVGLRDTAPPPAERPGFWGYTALSAMDVARAYRYLLERAPAAHRDLIMGELRKATRCGTDRYDQYFGIPRAVPRPWVVKQGWSGFGDVPATPCRAEGGVRTVSAPDLGLGRPVLHTTGVVGEGDRWIVVVLTLHPAGSSFQVAARRLTSLTRQVHQAANR
ncbi:lipoprotein [Actinomadura sp. NBRC 104412]|uniref:hypothetical protein n=1 Tax=Actinomadura sp. NBRC 104412 TaxID=3032203 RepID=UPI0024A330BB|nr:hypothetical protein [Actinomadura sp. NBRC 104412]GLZ07976.1 lipoprotein [Actinomadura sp. NBRC 104412]